VKLSSGAASAVSPTPANDEDADAKGATSGAGSPLARTGAGDRTLVLAAGLLLLVGGWSVVTGTPKRRRLAKSKR
jgi:hypothetical protein